MVIPPTICATLKSLLMEIFKKTEVNDTWKLDDFKKDVLSIDFHRILAADYHGNWLEQQLPQQRRLHPTTIEVKANEFLPRHHHQKTDLAQWIDRNEKRQLTFMAYPRDFNKVTNQVIKDKFPEPSTRSQCLNINLPTSLPWHHIPTRQKLNFPPRAYFPAHVAGRKWSSRFNARLRAVLKQFQVDDIQNLPRQQLWHLPGQNFPAEAEDFSLRPKIFRQAKAANCPARTANQSPAEIPAEAGLDKKYKLEKVKLTKRVNTVHVQDQKHELTPPKNRQTVTGLRDKPVTQQDALPNSEVPAKIPARAGPVVSTEASPLSSCQGSYQSSALQNRHNCNRLPHYDAT
ncbi:hypothetical protein V6N11_064454 [Hibiscus sabdariffa]|uniref:Uncharacterized protein n=1 Tax=Hibiscus sabdariffa TaxID=183260 RepID=A0ABR2P8Y8_9ROSI